MLKMILLMILTFSLPVTTAETPELIGKNQLSLHGGFDFQGPNGDSIDLRVGYDWFLRDDLLVGGEFQWAVVEDIAPGENDFRARQLSLVAEKLFPGGGKLVPYVGVEIGFRNTLFNNLDESGLVYGGRAGARYFLSESVSINGSVSILFSDKDVFIIDFETEDQYIYPGVGISAVF